MITGIQNYCPHSCRRNLKIAQRFRELRKRNFCLLRTGGLPVPLVVAFHEVNTLTHGRFHFYENRLAGTAVLCRLPEGVYHLLQVVAIHVEGMPAKSVKLVGNMAEPYDVLCGAVNLCIVAVANDDEIIDPVVGSKQRCFPYLPLLQFPVTYQTIDQPLVAIQFFTQSGTNGHRHTLPQRAGGDADTRKLLMRSRVTLQAGIELAESSQLFHRKVTRAGKYTVPDRRNMPIGEEKEIFSGALHRKGRIVVENFEVERNHQIGAAQRSARMPRLAAESLADNIPPNLAGNIL